MKTCSFALALLFFGLLFSGCTAVSYEYASTPAASHVETPIFTAGFSPEKTEAGFYSGFTLVVENRSSHPILIDWNRTRYLLDGRNLGGFVWESIDPASLKTNTVPKDQIGPGERFERRISPLAKVALASRRDYAAGRETPGLYQGILPPGVNGIRLAILAEGRTLGKEMTVTITEFKK